MHNVIVIQYCPIGNFLSEGRFWTTTLPHPSPNCHQSQKLEFCSYFCPKKCPSFACTFTKMSLSEGFGTLPFQTFLWTLPSDSYWFIFQSFPCTLGFSKCVVIQVRSVMGRPVLESSQLYIPFCCAGQQDTFALSLEYNQMHKSQGKCDWWSSPRSKQTYSLIGTSVKSVSYNKD